jgi:hypothetical protein
MNRFLEILAADGLSVGVQLTLLSLPDRVLRNAGSAAPTPQLRLI